MKTTLLSSQARACKGKNRDSPTVYVIDMINACDDKIKDAKFIHAPSGFWSKAFFALLKAYAGLALLTFRLFSLLTSWKAQKVKKKTLRLLMSA